MNEDSSRTKYVEKKWGDLHSAVHRKRLNMMMKKMILVKIVGKNEEA